MELYQNSGPNAEGKSLISKQPTILTQLPETPDVPAETEAPAAKSTTTPTTTTTKSSTQPSHYFTTSRPVVTTLSGHHFPVNSPDIRFNPEEINISLNPGGAPPDIRTKHYLQQQHVNFNSDSNKVKVGDQRTPPHLSATNTSPQTTVYRPQISSDVEFGFSEDDFRSTEHPRQQQFLIQTNSFRHSQSFPHSANQYLQSHYHSTTAKNNPSHPTTTRTLYIQPLKTSSTQHYRNEKTPERVQIPILPTIPPLTFSSPAPFSLHHHHVDYKRYTKDQHPSPPRIIISASASVSDASGRRLNYSLGTIGETELHEDDYKDDVTLGGLDPFYRDVPKVKRRKRSIDEEKSPFEVIKSEKEAVEVLKFLFKWYQSHQATATMAPVTSPVSTDLIQEINDELSPPVNVTTPRSDSEVLFLSSSEEVTSTETLKKTTFLDTPPSSMGSKLEFSTPELVVVTENFSESLMEERMDSSTEKVFNPDDYIDDNYEGLSGKSVVDPLAASELYKHVNVNKQLSDLQPHTPALINSSEKERHTEINVLSEVREELGSSSTTVASVRRRGRGRQKYPDNFQEASYNSNQINQISSGSGEGKKRRNRGRSRFIFSTSTTTEQAPLSETTTSTEGTTVSLTTTLENENTETTTSSPTTSQRNDPSYLVKLLKYFVETDTEMIYSSPTTDLPKTSYEPLTENQMPYFVTPIPPKDDSTKVTEKLLDKLERLQKTLSAMDDTTATTPIVSFAAMQSFGTTTSFENTTIPVGLETTTLTTEYHSLYDDIFSVPELAEVSTTTTKTDLDTTTDPFQVEIEKSISLPIGVLNPEDAINVNGLISSPTTEDNVQTTINPATTLIVPSTEVTSEEPTSTEFRFVTQTTEAVATTTELTQTTTESAPTTVNTIETTTIMPSTVKLLEENQETTFTPVTSLNSSHLEEVILETTTTLPPSTTSRRRPLRRRPNHSQRIGRHRFNTELTTRNQLNSENVTEAPLLKSVLPTKTRGQIAKVLLHTTPLSKQSQGRASKVGKNYVFNCFGKETNRFYADPRDCRLFHYCTHGYSKNQLLDLKYVCDHKTYFDEEKLICTKVKPPKCK